MKNAKPVVRARRLAACQRGGMAVMIALLVIPAIAAVGLAVDLTRLWLVQSRLQTAVDAAVLVAGRQINTTTASADATALFWSNFGRIEKTSGVGYLGAVAGEPAIQQLDADTVQVRATATLGATLMGVVGQGVTTVRAEASAKRALFGMELALVLDITGSMKSNDNIGGLRKAATDLVNIVFGANDTQPNLFVSVVPFTASVNIGKEHAGWLKPGTLDQSRYGSVGWAGCVEARAGGEDATDTPPGTASFKPFLWESTSGRYSNAGKPVAGDNDWTPSKITEQNQASLPDNTAVGPNLSCPQKAVLPLTSSKAAVLDVVNGLQATFRGGTTGNLGLQAGWFTLSPRWSGMWGTANSPLPYDTPYMQKIVVMMTDGDNLWYDWPSGAPGEAPSAYHDGKLNKDYERDGKPTPDADYTAYGRLSESRLGTTSISAAKTEIDARTTKLCKEMKKKGITIYSILLGVSNSATQNLWRDCATKPENFFNSPDKAALATAFQQIGTQLASLRLTQ